jgi:hypothetical protein
VIVETSLFFLQASRNFMLPRALKTNHQDVPAAVKSIKGSVPGSAAAFHGHHVKCSKQHVPDAGRLQKYLSSQQVKNLFIAKTATSRPDHVFKQLSIDLSKALQ